MSMKKAIMNCGIGGLNLIYSLMKLLPQQKKIVYLSRQQETTPLDFQLILEEVEKSHPDYKNVLLVKMVPDDLIGKIGYCFFILKQMYHIATAEAAVLDTYCIPICLLKQRKNLEVLQIWHALGAFKKFSFSILDQEEGRSSEMAKLMHMHENYTHILTSSEYCKPYFQEAFGAREDQMLVIPLPRADYICDLQVQEQVKEKIFRTYPALKDSGKKILVYAPTFRKYEVDFNQAVRYLVDHLDFDKYELIVKLHPLTKAVIDNPAVIQDDRFTTHEIFQVADAVIADYSAVIFEASLLELPMYFYDFDFEQYSGKRDFYLDYESMMPGPICRTAEELIARIGENACDLERVRAFRDLMIRRTEVPSAVQIAEVLTGSRHLR